MAPFLGQRHQISSRVCCGIHISCALSTPPRHNVQHTHPHRSVAAVLSLCCSRHPKMVLWWNASGREKERREGWCRVTPRCTCKLKWSRFFARSHQPPGRVGKWLWPVEPGRTGCHLHERSIGLRKQHAGTAFWRCMRPHRTQKSTSSRGRYRGCAAAWGSPAMDGAEIRKGTSSHCAQMRANDHIPGFRVVK